MSRSEFNLKNNDNSGISMNEIRTLFENTIIEENIQCPIKEKYRSYNKDFKKCIKQNKKIDRIYKKIEKLKFRLANLIGVTL